MAFAILHGIPQVFYWGEPYGGAIGDAYPPRSASALQAVDAGPPDGGGRHRRRGSGLWFVLHRAGARRFALLARLLVLSADLPGYAQLSTPGDRAGVRDGRPPRGVLMPGSTQPALHVGLSASPPVSWWSSRSAPCAPGLRSRPAVARPTTLRARPLRGRRVVLPGELAVLDVERATTGRRSGISRPGAD